MHRTVKSFIITSIFLLLFVSSGMAENYEIPDLDMNPEYLSSLDIISSDDLNIDPQGLCCGDGCFCIWSYSSYCIITKKNNKCMHYSIEHPYIKKDTAFIQQACFSGSSFYLLVTDIETTKSYIVKHSIDDHVQKYSELINCQLTSFVVDHNDCFCTGVKTQKSKTIPVITRISSDGTITWIKEPDLSGFLFETCLLWNNNLFTVCHDLYNARLKALKWDKNGEILLTSDFVFKNSPLQYEFSRYDIYHTSVVDNCLIFAGQEVSNTDATCAYSVRIDEMLNLIDISFYSDWSRIQDFFSYNEGHILFLCYSDNSLLYPNNHYLVTDDESLIIPLEPRFSGTTTLSFCKQNDNTLYIFGTIIEDDSLQTKSAFIAHIEQIAPAQP